ncbi:MAG: SIMPL domain-containing protein [Desulfobulbus sp.]|jgi:hypothetical protein|nr:SIMPL domain-containing protein [Desulfobulbus sp.]
MNTSSPIAALFLGVCIALGLAALGYQLADGVMRFRAMERTVSVKGLAEREVAADVAVWPIRFSEAANDLTALYTTLQRKNELVVDFLVRAGFPREEITAAAPAIIDRQAQSYSDANRAEYRYVGTSTLTVYSGQVDRVRGAMRDLVELGKQGIALSGEEYGGRPEFLFSELNAIKPAMIEEATRNAREVAEKFVRDSNSRLGRIRTANQGLFSIQDRDNNTQHLKRVRVVSTVEYYLVD